VLQRLATPAAEFAQRFIQLCRSHGGRIQSLSKVLHRKTCTTKFTFVNEEIEIRILVDYLQ
jgi:hypothetical protein